MNCPSEDLKELEGFINITLVKFLDIERENLDSELLKTFEWVGTLLDLDRVYFYNFSDDGTLMSMVSEWHSEGVTSYRKLMEPEAAYEFPWLIRKIKRDEHVAVSDMGELPDEAFSETDMLQRESVKSCLFIPLSVKGSARGFLGFDSIRKNLDWEPRCIELLRILGKLIITSKENILQRERLETKLYEQSLLLDYSDVQLWALKNTMVYGAVNEAHARFFGKDKSELQYQDLFDAFSPETADLLCKENWELFEKDGHGERELWIKNSFDEDRLLYIKSQPKLDEDGNIEHLICTAEDITEQRKAQDDLIKAKKEADAANVAKSEFLANMSHEIRTPMNGIMGFLQILEDSGLTEGQMDFLKEAKTSSVLLLNLINDILDFSKIEAGKINLEEIDFNIREAVESAVKLSAPKAYQKGLEVYTLINSNTPVEVIGDPGRLKQILNNLISNSVKFTEKGEITVSVDLMEEVEDSLLLRFEVSDTGIGISEEDTKKLFSKFSQADASTTRKYGGTGLGLAISKRLVELMKGEISVSSKLEEGSKFYFVCRFKKSRAAEKSYDILKGLRVLVLDSNPTGRKQIKNYLEGMGCILTEADNYSQAVNDIISADKNGTPNKIVIVGLKYSDPDTFEFARIVKSTKLANQVRLIYLIPFINKGEACTAKSKGYDAFLTKPLKLDELLDCITGTVNDEPRNQVNENLESIDKIMANIAMKRDAGDMNPDSKPKLLLVEDNDINRKLIIQIFKVIGLQCDIAVNGQEAVEACRSKDYDMIFMDCQMPVMDGYLATENIRKDEGGKKHNIIVALTANALKGDREKCLDAGMDDYLTKPIMKSEIVRIIKKYLDYFPL